MELLFAGIVISAAAFLIRDGVRLWRAHGGGSHNA